MEGLSPAVELLAEDAGDAPRLFSPTAPYPRLLPVALASTWQQ